MNDRELMQQALEALELGDVADAISVGELMDALRERLAQPETVMAEYTFQTYAAYKAPDGEMKIGVVPAMKEGKDFTISKPVEIEFKEWMHPQIGVVPVDSKTPLILKAHIREKNTT